MRDNLRKHVRQLSAAGLVCIGIFFPTSGSSQETQKTRGDEKSPSIVEFSQDRQLFALLGARDNQLAFIGELKRIIAYHDNFKSRLEREIGLSSQDTANRRPLLLINKELARLQKLEESLKAASNNEAKTSSISDFDQEFPIKIKGGSRAFDSRASFTSRTFGQRERTSANEIFQSVSIENREWLGRYEKVFSKVDSDLKALDPIPPSLENLPDEFNALADADSIEDMTDEQIKTALEKYKTALQEAKSTVTNLKLPNADNIRRRISADAETIGKEVVDRLADATSKLKDLEKSIAQQAKSLYGNKVGAESFNYLLAVFAIVFIVLMAVPKLYPDAIAINVLKSEFLLQFSTVFVLIAAIIILGIGDLIDKQQLPVLLAGISGYVLGQLGKA